MEYWCVIISGSCVVGPFKSVEEAEEWSKTNNQFKDDFYRIEKMVKPD